MAKYGTLKSLPWETHPASYLEEEDPVFRGRKPSPANPWPEYPVAEDELVKRSTKGSRPFTAAELKRGYRRV